MDNNINKFEYLKTLSIEDLKEWYCNGIDQEKNDLFKGLLKQFYKSLNKRIVNIDMILREKELLIIFILQNEGLYENYEIIKNLYDKMNKKKGN